MPLFTTDYDGTVRGAVWDIGAFEFGGSVPGDTTPPAVTLTSPSTGATVAGTVAVTAVATDNVGVVGVQFRLDGVNLGSEDTSSPYTVNWNTLTATNASHTLTAIARDAAGLTTSSSVTVTVFNPPAPPPPPVASLVAGYAFSAGSGLTAADASGNGNTGTLSGAGWTTGRYGNGLLFNGTSSSVTIPDTAALDFTTGLTVEAWVNPTTALSGYRSVVIKDDAYYLSASEGGGKALGSVIIGGQSYEALSASPLPVGLWSHLAMTYNGTTLRLYVNSSEVSNVPVTGTIANGTGPLRLGASEDGEYFPGKIDEVRLYNYALSQSAIQADMNTPIGSVADTAGPVISSAASSLVTSASARITWTTDEASDTQVDYGLTTSYGSSSTLNATLATSHQVDLVGLTPSTTYHYRVKSRDVANNLTTGTDLTFATTSAADVTAPVISAVTSSNIGPSSATITWTTNEVSTTQVQYGLTTSYGSITPPNTALVLSHSSGLTGLTASTLYHYQVQSRDGADNLSNGADSTFTTLAVPDGTPPIISSVLNTNPTASATTITWTTNEPGTTQVDYGTTTAYGSSSVFASSLVLSHSVSLTGLVANTIYHYRVRSLDAANNTANSADFTFVTAMSADTSAPDVSNGAPSGTLPVGTITATLSVTTNEAATCRYMTTPGVPFASMTNTFSTTGGTTHSTIVTGLVNGQTYSYYVKAQDGVVNAGNVDHVITFSVASVAPPPPAASLTVVAPNGGENWKVGKAKQIQWSSNGVSTNVKIELLRNGIYSTLFSDTANDGNASWTPTTPRSNSCKIRIASVDGLITASSAGFFKIT